MCTHHTGGGACEKHGLSAWLYKSVLVVYCLYKGVYGEHAPLHDKIRQVLLDVKCLYSCFTLVQRGKPVQQRGEVVHETTAI